MRLLVTLPISVEGFEHRKDRVPQGEWDHSSAEWCESHSGSPAISATAASPRRRSRSVATYPPVPLPRHDHHNVIKLIPDQSVLKLNIGDRIRLSAAQF